MTDDDFNESFLRANANVDFMASQLSDVLRSAIRAAAASDHTSQTYIAAETFQFLLQLMARAKEVSFIELLEKAIDDIRVEADDESVDAAVVHAARMGMRLLVERSCKDNAARGRASKRESEFLRAIEYIEMARLRTNA